MNLVLDLPRFRAALERMCRLHGMPAPTEQTLTDWASVLQPYDIRVIEPALDAARQEAGRYHVKAAAAEAKARALTSAVNHHASATTQGPTRYIPVDTDAQGRTIFRAEYRCWQCQDEGFVPVLCDETGESTGVVITMDDLRQRERDGRVHYRRRRCACRGVRATA